MFRSGLDVHELTITQLESLVRELDEEIRHLRDNVQSAGPSLERDHAIDERRRQRQRAVRELRHRHR